MIRGQEQDEFVTVRVQDPRVQNEGSWNSYVDFKIFLHTNSKAFTAKTSCVRRRYSEFVWLKRKLQKNSGLVPVPDLPGKSFFSFSNEDFIEKRRKGLQNFLNRVLHMTVCLSDSQLHLFLQTQLPVGHIQDCVQGHTPYTVTDAILTYASSNRGWAQEEEGGAHDSCSTPVPYESMESPAPHLPSSQCERPPQAPLSETGPANELQAESTDSHNLNSVELSLSETHSSVADSPQRDGPGDNMEEGERWADLVVEVHPQHFEGHGSEDAVPDQQPIGQLETVVRPDGTEENKPEEHEQVKIQSQAVRLTSNPLQERSGLKGQDGSHLEEATDEEVKMSEAAQLGTDCGEWVSGDMNKKVDCYNEMNKEVQQEMNKKECGHKEINKKEDDQEEINEKGDDHQETVKDNCIAEATLDVVSQCEEPTPAVCNGHVSEDTNCQDNIEGTATDHQVEVLTTEKSHVGMNHDALDPDVTNVLEDEDLALAEDTPEEATQVENQTSEDTSLQDKDLVMICQAEAVLSEDHEENDPLSTIFKPDISHFQELRLNSDDADGNSEIHMQKDSEVVSNICCVSETSFAESGSMQDACSAETCLDSGLKSYSNHSVMQTVQALETDSKVTEAI